MCLNHIGAEEQAPPVETHHTSLDTARLRMEKLKRSTYSSPFGAKLPYCPIIAVLVIEEFDKGISRVSIGSLRKGGRGAGSCDDCIIDDSASFALKHQGWRKVDTVLLSAT